MEMDTNDWTLAAERGWKVHHHSPVSEGNWRYLYLLDTRTQFVWMGCVLASEFQKVLEKFKTDITRDVREAASALAQLALQCHANNLEGQSEQSLAATFTGYYGMTRSAQLAEDSGAKHLLISIYPGDGGMARPFAMAPKVGGPMAVTQLKECFEQVMSQDRRIHPEWFVA